MLTGIQVRDSLNSFKVLLPVTTGEGTDPYRITDIQGIGPVKADVTTAPYATQRGSILQATRVGVRNLVIKIAYKPDYKTNKTVQILRREIYSILAPGNLVNLVFLNSEDRSVQIEGVVESHDPVIFSQEPEVQISILCTDPSFESMEPLSLNGFNDSAINPSYYGTAPSGFLLEYYITRGQTGVIVSNGIQDSLSYTRTLVQDDVLRISTVRGNKFVTLTRNGTDLNDLDYITGDMSMAIDSQVTNFLVLGQGSNNIPFRLTYTPKFVGI